MKKSNAGCAEIVNREIEGSLLSGTNSGGCFVHKLEKEYENVEFGEHNTAILKLNKPQEEYFLGTWKCISVSTTWLFVMEMFEEYILQSPSLLSQLSQTAILVGTSISSKNGGKAFNPLILKDILPTFESCTITKNIDGYSPTHEEFVSVYAQTDNNLNHLIANSDHCFAVRKVGNLFFFFDSSESATEKGACVRIYQNLEDLINFLDHELKKENVLDLSIDFDHSGVMYSLEEQGTHVYYPIRDSLKYLKGEKYWIKEDNMSEDDLYMKSRESFYSKRYYDTLHYATRALDINPCHVHAIFFRSWSQIKLGVGLLEARKGMEDVLSENSLQKDRDGHKIYYPNYFVHYLLGIANSKLGYHGRAAKHYDISNRLHPSFNVCHNAAISHYKYASSLVEDDKILKNLKNALSLCSKAVSMKVTGRGRKLQSKIDKCLKWMRKKKKKKIKIAGITGERLSLKGQRTNEDNGTIPSKRMASPKNLKVLNSFVALRRNPVQNTISSSPQKKKKRTEEKTEEKVEKKKEEPSIGRADDPRHKDEIPEVEVKKEEVKKKKEEEEVGEVIHEVPDKTIDFTNLSSGEAIIVGNSMIEENDEGEEEEGEKVEVKPEEEIVVVEEEEDGEEKKEVPEEVVVLDDGKKEEEKKEEGFVLEENVGGRELVVEEEVVNVGGEGEEEVVVIEEKKDEKIEEKKEEEGSEENVEEKKEVEKLEEEERGEEEKPEEKVEEEKKPEEEKEKKEEKPKEDGVMDSLDAELVALEGALGEESSVSEPNHEEEKNEKEEEKPKVEEPVEEKKKEEPPERSPDRAFHRKFTSSFRSRRSKNRLRRKRRHRQSYLKYRVGKPVFPKSTKKSNEKSNPYYELLMTLGSETVSTGDRSKKSTFNLSDFSIIKNEIRDLEKKRRRKQKKFLNFFNKKKFSKEFASSLKMWKGRFKEEDWVDQGGISAPNYLIGMQRLHRCPEFRDRAEEIAMHEMRGLGHHPPYNDIVDFVRALPKAKKEMEDYWDKKKKLEKRVSKLRKRIRDLKSEKESLFYYGTKHHPYRRKKVVSKKNTSSPVKEEVLKGGENEGGLSRSFSDDDVPLTAEHRKSPLESFCFSNDIFSSIIISSTVEVKCGSSSCIEDMTICDDSKLGGDGDCQFDAVCEEYFGFFSPEKSIELRKGCSEYIQKSFGSDVLLSCPFAINYYGKFGGLEGYCAHVRKSGNCGDLFTLYATWQYIYDQLERHLSCSFQSQRSSASQKRTVGIDVFSILDGCLYRFRFPGESECRIISLFYDVDCQHFRRINKTPADSSFASPRLFDVSTVLFKFLFLRGGSSKGNGGGGDKSRKRKRKQSDESDDEEDRESRNGQSYRKRRRETNPNARVRVSLPEDDSSRRKKKVTSSSSSESSESASSSEEHSSESREEENRSRRSTRERRKGSRKRKSRKRGLRRSSLSEDPRELDLRFREREAAVKRQELENAKNERLLRIPPPLLTPAHVPVQVPETNGDGNEDVLNILNLAKDREASGKRPYRKVFADPIIPRDEEKAEAAKSILDQETLNEKSLDDMYAMTDEKKEILDYVRTVSDYLLWLKRKTLIDRIRAEEIKYSEKKVYAFLSDRRSKDGVGHSQVLVENRRILKGHNVKKGFRDFRAEMKARSVASRLRNFWGSLRTLLPMLPVDIAMRIMNLVEPFWMQLFMLSLRKGSRVAATLRSRFGKVKVPENREWKEVDGVSFEVIDSETAKKSDDEYCKEYLAAMNEKLDKMTVNQEMMIGVLKRIDRNISNLVGVADEEDGEIEEEEETETGGEKTNGTVSDEEDVVLEENNMVDENESNVTDTRCWWKKFLQDDGMFPGPGKRVFERLDERFRSSKLPGLVYFIALLKNKKKLLVCKVWILWDKCHGCCINPSWSFPYSLRRHCVVYFTVLQAFDMDFLRGFKRNGCPVLKEGISGNFFGRKEINSTKSDFSYVSAYQEFMTKFQDSLKPFFNTYYLGAKAWRRTLMLTTEACYPERIKVVQGLSNQDPNRDEHQTYTKEHGFPCSLVHIPFCTVEFEHQSVERIDLWDYTRPEDHPKLLDKVESNTKIIITEMPSYRRFYGIRTSHVPLRLIKKKDIFKHRKSEVFKVLLKSELGENCLKKGVSKITKFCKDFISRHNLQDRRLEWMEKEEPEMKLYFEDLDLSVEAVRSLGVPVTDLTSDRKVKQERADVKFVDFYLSAGYDEVSVLGLKNPHAVKNVPKKIAKKMKLTVVSTGFSHDLWDCEFCDFRNIVNISSLWAPATMTMELGVREKYRNEAQYFSKCRGVKGEKGRFWGNIRKNFGSKRVKSLFREQLHSRIYEINKERKGMIIPFVESMNRCILFLVDETGICQEESTFFCGHEFKPGLELVLATSHKPDSIHIRFIGKGLLLLSYGGSNEFVSVGTSTFHHLEEFSEDFMSRHCPRLFKSISFDFRIEKVGRLLEQLDGEGEFVTVQMGEDGLSEEYVCRNVLSFSNWKREFLSFNCFFSSKVNKRISSTQKFKGHGSPWGEMMYYEISGEFNPLSPYCFPYHSSKRLGKYDCLGDLFLFDDCHYEGGYCENSDLDKRKFFIGFDPTGYHGGKKHTTGKVSLCKNISEGNVSKIPGCTRRLRKDLKEGSEGIRISGFDGVLHVYGDTSVVFLDVFKTVSKEFLLFVIEERLKVMRCCLFCLIRNITCEFTSLRNHKVPCDGCIFLGVDAETCRTRNVLLVENKLRSYNSSLRKEEQEELGMKIMFSRVWLNRTCTHPLKFPYLLCKTNDGCSVKLENLVDLYERSKYFSCMIAFDGAETHAAKKRREFRLDFFSFFSLQKYFLLVGYEGMVLLNSPPNHIDDHSIRLVEEIFVLCTLNDENVELFEVCFDQLETNVQDVVTKKELSEQVEELSANHISQLLTLHDGYKTFEICCLLAMKLDLEFDDFIDIFWEKVHAEWKRETKKVKPDRNIVELFGEALQIMQSCEDSFYGKVEGDGEDE